MDSRQKKAANEITFDRGDSQKRRAANDIGFVYLLF